MSIKWNLEKAKEFVITKGSEMRADIWTGTHGFYYFKCIECGEWKYTRFHNIQSGNLKCVKCGLRLGNKKVHIKDCEKCAKKFKTYNSGQKFCSDKCRQNIERTDITKDLLIDLYINKRFSSLKIAKMFRVAKITILRKLNKFNIETRTSQGSKHEIGFKMPTKVELEELYVKQFLTYDKICKIYDVDMTLIMSWLKKYNIPARTCSESRLGSDFKEPTKEELIDLYVAKGLNSRDIGDIYGIDGQGIVRRMRKYKIKIKNNSFGNSSLLMNGIKVKSSYEKTFGDLLCENNIKFDYEPQLSFNHHYHSDFLINNTYVEIWGVVGNKKYDERKNKKIQLYNSNGFKLISLYPKDFKDFDYNIIKNIILQENTEVS